MNKNTKNRNFSLVSWKWWLLGQSKRH